jgi:mannose-6-phosphate isomerase-like protein (cupin superfamily)
MRTLAILLGTVAAVAFGAAVSADPAGVKVAQGQDSATHSGGATQSRAAGNRESGTGARSSESSSSHSATNAGSRTSRMGARGSEMSRSTARTEGSGRISTRERSETTGVSVRSGGGHAIGVRAADNDDEVVIRRKRARHYVETEPCAVFVCAEGSGTTTVDGKVLEWGPNDVFVVPPWKAYAHTAAKESVLFSISDRPSQ